ncbi:type III-B CRISPR module-associated protein Cmr5, partial [bacterium]|nr:type III-B CRISPR module-associated protein Cmr5 [bacterium]
MAQTLEQKRAKFALEKVMAVAKQDNKTQGKYRSRLLNLGTQIHQNGLGQTMAFYLS